MLFLLAMNASGARVAHPELVTQIEAGALSYAAVQVKLAMESALQPLAEKLRLGRLLAYLHLALGRDVEAEELLAQQRKRYAASARDAMRCNTPLDHAMLLLAQHRWGRAAQCACQVIDDTQAQPEQLLEALAILCECLGGLGEHDARKIALEEARRLADRAADPVVAWALSAMDLRQSVRNLIKPVERRDQVVMCLSAVDGVCACTASLDQLLAQVNALSGTVSRNGLLFQCLGQLQSLLWLKQGDDEHAGRLLDHIRWLHERDVAGSAEDLRVDAALASLSAQNHVHAMRFIQPLVADEARIGRHRLAASLHYCMAALHAHAGRAEQAFRALNEHAVATTRLLRAELVKMKLPRAIAERHEARSISAEALRLPVRYRPAYRYITENLSSPDLSVLAVAEQVQVTPRMLQLTFREHLGITPADLIRRLRLAHIQDEMAEQPGRLGVLRVAKRWGITSRSTLTRGLLSRLPAASPSGEADGVSSHR